MPGNAASDNTVLPPGEDTSGHDGPGMARRPTITVETGIDHPFVPYALSLTELATGLEISLSTPQDRPALVDLYYGRDPRRPCRIRIPHVSAYSRDTVPRIPNSRAREAARTLGAAFPFDVFAALRFWLADEGNGPADAGRDEHGRVVAATSAQSEIAATRLPIVNAYLALLRSWIQQRTGVAGRAMLPPGKRCAVVLTHDVDNPVDPADRRHRAWLAVADARHGRPRRALRHVREAVRTTYGGGTPISTKRLFRDITRVEQHHGFRSTFFFAPVSCFSPIGHGFDVGYDLSAPRFRPVMRELRDSGAEIGLHASYTALADGRRIARERELVETVAGIEVRGCRHHYFHTSEPPWPSLEAHVAAGLSYDSSVSFAREAGYRLGIAMVTRLWNPVAQRPISALQIPPMAMDAHFYYARDQTLEDTLSQFSGLLDGLKEYDGVAALDWHEYTASTLGAYGHWAEGYSAILDLLASDPEVAVLRCAEAMALSRPTRSCSRGSSTIAVKW
jgi:hypothetical protein